MKRILFTVFLLLLFSTSYTFSQDNMLDVIYLKNGFVVKGEIVKLVVNEYVMIKLINGIVNTYKMRDIVKIEKLPRPKNAKPPPKKVAPPPSENSTTPQENIEPLRGQFQSSQQSGFSRIDPKPQGYRSPGVAFLLSFFFTGAGQFYNGEVGKGLGQILIVGTGYAILLTEAGDDKGNFSGDGINSAEFGGLALILGGALWSVIDAPISASKKNKRLKSGKSFNHLIEIETGRQIVGVDLGFDGKSLGGKITLHF